MRKVLSGAGLLLSAAFVMAFTLSDQPVSAPPASEGPVKWYTFEEAVKLNQTNPKKMFVDVFTDWCGWCKKMDSSTFTDPQVAGYLNEHFYPVKFNAEQKEDVLFKEYTLKYLPNTGRRGVHELAYALLDGRMGYPSFVYLDENQDRITISPGYKTADVILKELKFVAENHYKTQTYQQYAATSNQ